MQKAIRLLSIIATALVGLSLILLVASIPFQRVIARDIYNSPADMIAGLPQFPLLPFLFCLLRAGCVAVLIVCCGNKKGGFWLEILICVLLAIVFPAIYNIASLFCISLIVKFGELRLAAYTTVSNLASYFCYPANLGEILAYITCGMSIAFKVMSKKQNRVG